MRRIKAIYLIPVFAILLVGAVFAEYYLLIVPQMKKTNDAQQAWQAAKKECEAEEPKYETNLKAQVENSKKLLDNYNTFHAIQNSMPKIYAMQSLYAGKERDGLRELYRMMSTPMLANELSRWVKGYHLKYNGQFAFTGTLPFEDGLTDIKFIEIDFGEQTFVANGYADLVRKVQLTSGYGFFPLLIEPKEKIVTIKVDTSVPYNPKAPRLTMPYTAKGYMFTRGWDPNGPTAKDEVAKALALLKNPPVATPSRAGFDKPPPVMFWYFPPKDIVP